MISKDTAAMTIIVPLTVKTRKCSMPHETDENTLT